MAVDPKVKEAIEVAVRNARQPPSLAKKLSRWFEAIATGNEDINNTQSADRHLDLLYEEVETRTATANTIELDEMSKKTPNDLEVS